MPELVEKMAENIKNEMRNVGIRQVLSQFWIWRVIFVGAERMKHMEMIPHLYLHLDVLMCKVCRPMI